MNGHFVVTISHQLGCGGAQVGKQLSEMLSVPFIDRQILKRAAEELRLPEEDVAEREERKSSLWESFSKMELYSDPLTTATAEYLPTDRELFTLESDCIEQIAQEGSAVILGRGARYILRGFPRHFSVFLCADLNDRVQRVRQLYGLAEPNARKMIEKNDRERSAYMKTFTKLDLLDARNYDLCLNTSSIGAQRAPSLIADCLAHKFQ